MYLTHARVISTEPTEPNGLVHQAQLFGDLDFASSDRMGLWHQLADLRRDGMFCQGRYKVRF